MKVKYHSFLFVFMHRFGGPKLLAHERLNQQHPLNSSCKFRSVLMLVAAIKKSEKRATDGAVSRVHYTESTVHGVYFYKVFYARKNYILQVLVYFPKIASCM